MERFGTAKRFAAYFGFVPRTNQTGGKDGKPGQRLTKGGPTLPKQYLFLAAETARRHDPELAATYDRAQLRGKHPFDAVCIVAHKLLRKVYALLKLRANARGAIAEGRPAPAIIYRICRPTTGETLTSDQVKAWIAEHCPSKAEARRRQTRKKAVEAAPSTSSQAQTGSGPNTGSSEDATHEGRGTPPRHEVANQAACGKIVDNPVANFLNGHVNFSVDST